MRYAQSLPISCHFGGCKVPLFRIVSGAISSELAFYGLWRATEKKLGSWCPVFQGHRRSSEMTRIDHLPTHSLTIVIAERIVVIFPNIDLMW